MRPLAALIVFAAGCATPAPSRPVQPGAGPVAVSALQPVSAAPTAAELLVQMRATYAGLAHYSDTGELTTEYEKDHKQRVAHQTFTTAFVRDDRFRFEVVDQGKSMAVIWFDGRHALTHLVGSPEMTDEGANLGTALAAFAGISNMTSARIPSLLMPQFARGFDGFHLASARVTEAEMIAEHPCWKLTASTERIDTAIWIDQQSHLVRKITDHFLRDPSPRPTADPDFQLTTTYAPVVDEAVAAARLAQPEGPIVPRDRPAWVGLWLDRNSARITSVVRGAPAAVAGVKSGDTIVSFDGVAIASAHDFISRARAATPDKPVALVVDRGGTQLQLSITPEPRPDQMAQAESLVDQSAPAFGAPVVSGNGPAKLADLAGHVVIVDFWATWCGPCQITAPRLQALSDKYGKRGLVVVGLSDDADADIRDFAKELHLTYTLARDADSHVAQDYMVQGLPTMVVIDRAGVVRKVEIGASDLIEIDALVAKLLP